VVLGTEAHAAVRPRRALWAAEGQATATVAEFVSGPLIGRSRKRHTALGSSGGGDEGAVLVAVASRHRDVGGAAPDPLTALVVTEPIFGTAWSWSPPGARHAAAAVALLVAVHRLLAAASAAFSPRCGCFDAGSALPG
jgi:hypothetical protein